MAEVSGRVAIDRLSANDFPILAFFIPSREAKRFLGELKI